MGRGFRLWDEFAESVEHRAQSIGQRALRMEHRAQSIAHRVERRGYRVKKEKTGGFGLRVSSCGLFEDGINFSKLY